MSGARLVLPVLLALFAAAVWAMATGRGDLWALAARAVYLPMGITAPDLDQPARIRRGAAQYAQVCVACHASPAAPLRAAPLLLRPPAPVLHLRLSGWPDERLFHIVRDGVPGSGMPAWPVPRREDEVWDMVAFLRRLPGLDAAGYADLTAEDALGGQAGTARGCIRCHGPRGAGRDGIPRLDTQSPAYLEQALLAFRDRRRASGVMQIAVAGLDDAALERLARRFGTDRKAQPPISAPPPVVTAGAAGRKVPPCAACHGLTDPVRPEFPRLAGQDSGYVTRQLHLFADQDAGRGGGPFAPLMAQAGHALRPADIAAAAQWYSAIPLE